MGCCEDCRYYEYGECNLTGDSQNPYDSCEDFEARHFYNDDDDDGDGKDDLFDIFINPAGSIENFMGLE